MLNFYEHTLDELHFSATNVSHTQYFLESGTDPFCLPNWITPTGYYSCISLSGNEYRLIHEATQQTVYVAKLTPRSLTSVEIKPATEIEVWETFDPGHEAAISGLSNRFLEYLVTYYTIVLSQNQMQPELKAFWAKRVARALRFGLTVYSSSLSDWRQYARKIETYEEFYMQWSQWVKLQSTGEFNNQVIIISTDELV